ncbi:MAG: mandelate racemase/muconate lactonizing enzyme family protein [Pseudomonadota bacterium]
MKIARIDAFQIDLPYAGGTYHLSGGRTYHSFDATIVRVTADNGLEGWGESTPFGSTYVAAHAKGVRAGLAEIAPGLIGADPRHVDRLNDRMDELLRGHSHVKAPIDVACWDLFGQAVGMPVCDLLGGRTEHALPTISSIHADDPEDMRARVADHRRRGYRGHSIKIGALDRDGGPALDAERIAASLADREPGEFYLVDANGGLTPETALRMIGLLKPGLDFVLEATCTTWAETMSLRRRCSIPIFLDELVSDDESVAQMIADDVADGIGLKITKNGGLTKGRRQRDMCIAAGKAMTVQDTVGSEIAFAAIVHLGQSVPERSLRCILDCRDMVAVTTAEFHAPNADSGVRAPMLPGLGVKPDLDLLGEPVASWA